MLRFLLVFCQFYFCVLIKTGPQTRDDQAERAQGGETEEKNSQFSRMLRFPMLLPVRDVRHAQQYEVPALEIRPVGIRDVKRIFNRKSTRKNEKIFCKKG